MSRILIIEDEEAIADLEKDYLELSGFEVEIANRGDVGLEKALNEDYDLIILDLMLPAMSEEVLKKSGDIPFIVVSAKADIDDKVKMLKNGAQDYMTKLFSARELTENMGGTIDSEINEGVLSIILMLKISSFYRNDLFLC